jgi:hypothetical protein
LDHEKIVLDFSAVEQLGAVALELSLYLNIANAKKPQPNQAAILHIKERNESFTTYQLVRRMPAASQIVLALVDAD